MARMNCMAGTIALLLSFPAGAAWAVESLPIIGTYMQNRPCHGDGTDAKPLLVTIHEDDIVYRSGTCTLSDKRVEGNKVSVRATCKTKSGAVLSGDITFTVRDDKNLEMVDRDKNYHAVLNRCPN